MDFYAINIHAKSNYGDSAEEYEKAYERRKMAAEGLYNYLITHKPDANIILLGDYNDDVDESIFYYDEPGNWAETPYLMFVEDEKNFDILTKKFSDSGQSASIHYEDIIDHITISDELFNYQIDNSTEIIDAQSLIPDYGNTTSDHLPVWTTFEIASNN
jgi:exonuclease III